MFVDGSGLSGSDTDMTRKILFSAEKDHNGKKHFYFIVVNIIFTYLKVTQCLIYGLVYYLSLFVDEKVALI